VGDEQGKDLGFAGAAVADDPDHGHRRALGDLSRPACALRRVERAHRHEVGIIAALAVAPFVFRADDRAIVAARRDRE
jgi:hypothetical protein